MRRLVLALLFVPALASADVSFTALAPIAVTVGDDAGPQALAIADVSGDGVADLLAIDREDDQVRVLLGRGDGTFDEPVVYPLEGTPTAVTVADVASSFASDLVGDADGQLDLIVAHEDGFVEVLLGRGDGSFDPPEQDFTDVLDSLELIGVAVHDLDGNGRLDLVLLDFFEEVYFLCNEAGQFGPCATDVVCTDGFGATALALGDFEGDGFIDVAVASQETRDLRIIPGRGGGVFDATALSAFDVSVDPAQEPVGVAAAELDGDAGDEFVVALAGGVAQSLATVGLADLEIAVEHFDGGSGLRGLAAADFSGDGAVDALLVTATAPAPLVFAAGTAAGGFDAALAAPGTEAIASGRSVVAGDLDGDGVADAAVLAAAGDAVVIALTAAAPVCAGDCDGDGAVSISELVTGVNIAIGTQATDVCAAFDRNGSGTVTIDELVGAVLAALDGCPA